MNHHHYGDFAGAAELSRRRAAVLAHRSHAAARQRDRGRRSAWERIAMLLDAGSFTEVGSLVRRGPMKASPSSRPGDAVVTGHGTVHGMPVCCFAQDFTVSGGSLGEAAGRKIVKIMDLALDAGAPVIGINDSAGGRIQEGVVAQALYGEIFTRNVRMSGAVPQISVMCGPCAGGAAYSPALTDFVVMVEGTSHMFVTGPEATRHAVGERVGLEELGGARMHNTLSGTAHYLAVDEDDAFRFVRALLSHLPAAGGTPGSGMRAPGRGGAAPAGTASVPPPSSEAHRILSDVLDPDGFLETQALFATEAVTGFGWLGGASVGVVAARPLGTDGLMGAAECDKVARFVRTCDAFGLPIVTFAGVAGRPRPVAPAASTASRNDMPRLMYAYAEATVPLLTVLAGPVSGAGYLALGSRHLGSDIVLAWPGAGAGELDAFAAAECGAVDEVIDPDDTRERLHRALWLLRSKRRSALPRKHGNLPL
ncbi:acyl-CoA carboxylase subunit beta [Streptomyces sp. NPDC054770]